MTTVTITGAVIVDGERHELKIDVELPDEEIPPVLMQSGERVSDYIERNK